MTEIAFALLAGGRASRYGGIPKGLLKRPDGATLVEHLLQVAAAAGLEQRILVANDAEPYKVFGCTIVGDLRPGCGPLGGIEAALAHFSREGGGVLFLPCDLPGMTASVPAALREAFASRGKGVAAARTDGFSWHPLCSVVHIHERRAVAEALDRGELGVGRLWDRLGAEAVDFPDPSPFFNVNSPEDMDAWRKRREVP